MASTSIPEGWTRGELLNVQRYPDRFDIRPMWATEAHQTITFYTADEAQAFVSWWYAPPGLIQPQEQAFAHTPTA